MDDGAYLPFLPLPREARTSSYALTTIIIQVYGRTDRTCDRTRMLCTILHAVCGDGGGVRRGPRTTTSFGPQRELPPAKLVIHRTDLYQHNVGNAEGCSRGQASVLLHPATLAADNGELRITSASHGEAAACGRGATPLSTEFRARNHAALLYCIYCIVLYYEAIY